MELADTDIAWFTGVFEGEGNFSIEKNGNIKLCIRMTDEDIIDRIKAMFPAHQNLKPVQMKPRTPGGAMPKVQYAWRVSKPDEVKRITELMLPMLGIRRSAKAREVLEKLANRKPNGWHQMSKTHCAQGHELTPENTMYKYKDRPNVRTCRTCYKIWYGRANAKATAKARAARATVQSQSPEQ